MAFFVKIGVLMEYLFILIPVIIIILIIFIVLISKPKRISEEHQRIKYLTNEELVANELEKLIIDKKGHLINNLCFQDEEGYSSEIDHILITKAGVFVIETKSNFGKISGNEDDIMWQSYYKDTNETKEIINPVRQNKGHINHLRKMFTRNSPKMYSVIIILYGDISDIKINNAYHLDDAISYIKNKMSQNVYDDKYVDKIYKLFLNLKNRYVVLKEDHINNVNSIYKENKNTNN